MQYLHKDEYLKGIKVYESIIKAYASFDERLKDGTSKDELWASGVAPPYFSIPTSGFVSDVTWFEVTQF